jgi:hypothetical protein
VRRALDLVSDRDLPGVVGSGGAGPVLSGEMILVDDDDPLPTTASKARRRKWIAAGPKPPVVPVAPVRGPPAGKAAEPQGPPPAPPPATTEKTYERFE